MVLFPVSKEQDVVGLDAGVPFCVGLPLPSVWVAEVLLSAQPEPSVWAVVEVICGQAAGEVDSPGSDVAVEEVGWSSPTAPPAPSVLGSG